jgi:hypothetical protein
MRRKATFFAMMAALGCIALASPQVIASEVVVSISGRFGEFDYGNQPAPLNDGYFSGTVTFASLPGPHSTVISSTADVNFYDSSHNLLFTLDGPTYDTMSAGSHGYTYLSVGGIVDLGTGTSVDIAPLSLEFKHWDFGHSTGIVKPYGPPNYDSTVEYTYFPTGSDPEDTGTTYFNPVCRGQACATISSVPEPASIMLGLIGFAGALAFSRFHRRNATA